MLLRPTPPIQDKVFPSCQAVIWMTWWSWLLNVIETWVSICCRCNFLLNKATDKILLLSRRREKYLVVGAVRFVRAILSRHVSLNLCAYTVCFDFGRANVSEIPLPQLYIYQLNLDILPQACNFRVNIGLTLTGLYQQQIKSLPPIITEWTLTGVFIFEASLLIYFFFRVRHIDY